MTRTADVGQDNAAGVDPEVPEFAARSKTTDRWIFFGSVAAVTAMSAWLGFYTMFNTFGWWDDEGYMLIALKSFAHHGGLYTKVASQYGPFYFEVFSPIFAWLPVTHDSGRLATLVVALLACLGFAVAMKMLTGSVLVAVATQVGGFLLLSSFKSESMHPTVVVALLLSVVLVALAMIATERRSAGCTVLGAAVAALILTQINAGAFASIAILFTGLTFAPWPRRMRVPRAAAAALFVATPFLLIGVARGNDSNRSSALSLALIVALAAAGVVVAAYDRDSQGLVHRSDAYRFFLGGGALGAFVVGVALASGTRPLDLVRGVLVGPANQSNVFAVPLQVALGVEVWGAACLGGAIWYRKYRRRNSTVGLVDACAHLGAGLLILYFALAQTQIHGPFVIAGHTAALPLRGLFVSAGYTVALPLVFLAAVPTARATDSERIARVAIAALAVLESLLAYPVAGEQVKWASLLLVPAGMLCVHDGVRALRPSPIVRSRRLRRTGLVASVAVLAGCGWLAWVFLGNLSHERHTYRAETPSALPGSGLMHLPAGQTKTYEAVSRAIRKNCSTFVSLPGMNSFYFWSNKEPPTSLNTNSWFYLVDAAEQERIVRSIESRDQSRVCVLDSKNVLYFWTHGRGRLPSRPLLTFIRRFERDHKPPQQFLSYRLFMAKR